MCIFTKANQNDTCFNAVLRARYWLLAHSPLPLMHMPALAHEARSISQIYYDFTTDTTYAFNLNCADYFGKKNVWTGPGGQGWPPKVYRPPV